MTRGQPSAPAEVAVPPMTVIVCAFTEERWGDLSRAMESIRAQRLAPLETILVIDHNQSLFERATEAFSWARVIRNAGEQGLSDGRNTGVRAAQGTVVAFLDDDAQAAPDWLAVLASAYVDPAVVSVGGSAEPEWDAGRPSWFPPEFDWVVGCSYVGLPTSRKPVRNPLGCNMSFRHEAFEAAGPFETTIGRVGSRPVGDEETEFCIRVRRAMPGSVILYDPAARVRHRVRRNRGTWGYFVSRCYAEGLSKAIVSQLAGSGAGLSSERRYATVTLPLGVVRNVVMAPTRPSRILRAGAIIIGLAVTTTGYVRGRIAGVGSRR